MRVSFSFRHFLSHASEASDRPNRERSERPSLSCASEVGDPPYLTRAKRATYLIVPRRRAVPQDQLIQQRERRETRQRNKQRLREKRGASGRKEAFDEVLRELEVRF